MIYDQASASYRPGTRILSMIADWQATRRPRLARSGGVTAPTHATRKQLEIHRRLPAWNRASRLG
jgi:hypothetical protein